jgi:hypothetical protein
VINFSRGALVALVALVALGISIAGVDLALVRVARGSTKPDAGELRYERLSTGLTLVSAADIEAGIVPKGRFVPLYP